jgi:hypothetical protein
LVCGVPFSSTVPLSGRVSVSVVIVLESLLVVEEISVGNIREKEKFESV